MKRSGFRMLLVCGLTAAVALVACGKASAWPWPLPYPLPKWPHPHPVVVKPVVVVVSNPAPAIIPVAVVNPASTGATLSFSIDGTRYDLAPGARQEMRLAGVPIIQFDRGGSFGLATYSLYEGVYTFRATDKGWELERVPYQPAAIASR